MIGEKRTFEWLEHRAGVRELSRHPSAYRTRALELNDKGNTFAAAYGRKEIKGFVGFVDLIGFSTKVTGSSASGMSEYLKPFLVGVIEKAVHCGALVDKTIGDEVMFVLPDMGTISGVFEGLDEGIVAFGCAVIGHRKLLSSICWLSCCKRVL